MSLAKDCSSLINLKDTITLPFQTRHLGWYLPIIQKLKRYTEITLLIIKVLLCKPKVAAL